MNREQQETKQNWYGIREREEGVQVFKVTGL